MFVHLHLHTEYSLIDSVVRIKSEAEGVPGLMDAVAAGGMPAVALTDQNNLFAMVKFYRAAQSAGVKPIVGVDLKIRELGERVEPSTLVLLCQNEVGYLNLSRLVSRCWLEGQQKGIATVDRGWLTTDNLSGLIALSGARDGDVGRALVHDRGDEARAALNFWLKLFGDRYYLELQRTGRDAEERCLQSALQLAIEHGVPVVATNDVRFIRGDDFAAHEARVCIQEGAMVDDPRRRRRYSDQQYLKSPRQMAELFRDAPEAIENSVEIARRCTLELKLGKPVLPAYPVPSGLSTEDYLREESQGGLKKRWVQLAAAPVYGRAIAQEEYEQRLQTELGVICQMGFAGYFLIVADFIRWARENGVPVGPGRGSGAGSLAAYALGITDLDPLRYDLLFERFLNPERVSMPDFDVDFCMEGRDRVIEYVAERYGRERVSQIITYGTMAAKAVVRDVARVFGMSYGFADSIAKLIPFELGITLKDALAKEEELRRRYQNEEETRAVLDMAMSLEGLVRNAGMHAGGVVIAPSVLTDFAPLFCDDAGNNVVTQFDKDDVEAAGLVKFDFLGLRTLTIIDWAVRIINAGRARKGEPALDISALPMDDKLAFELLKRCETTAIFQLESRGMKDLVRRLQPDCFEEIVALVALFRPGPLQSGMVDDFIARKHGKTTGPIDYLHPELKPVLAPTYGVILYQEQVMQIANRLAGFSLGEADILRRAMGKKKREEMAAQREKFVAGSHARKVPAAKAGRIFDLMAEFAGYGFNKSHSCAYALLAYQTAYLKTHYPVEFTAALLTSETGNTEKVVKYINEARSMGITVMPPDVNSSAVDFTPVGEAIRFGLRAIKNVGENTVKGILQARDELGSFRSIFQFCQSVDPRQLNRRVLESLIRAGAMDSLGARRAQLFEVIDRAIERGQSAHRERSSGQHGLFGGGNGAAPLIETEPPMPDVEEWPEDQLLAQEYATLGFYISSHPLARFAGRLKDLGAVDLGALGGLRNGDEVSVAAIVVNQRAMRSKRGDRWSIVTLQDMTGGSELLVFPEAFSRLENLLKAGVPLFIKCRITVEEVGTRLVALEVKPLDEVVEPGPTQMRVRVDVSAADAMEMVERLEELFLKRPGPCRVTFELVRADGCTAMLESRMRVKHDRQLIEEVQRMVGTNAVLVQR